MKTLASHIALQHNKCSFGGPVSTDYLDDSVNAPTSDACPVLGCTYEGV